MKKFFNRFFNVIFFLIALGLFLPWQKVSSVISKIGLGFIGRFFTNHGSFKLLLFPLIAIFISFIFLIVSTVEKKNSPNNITKKSTQNTAYGIIYYIGISASLAGFVHNLMSFINKSPEGFMIIDNDYFTLGRFINNFPYLKTYQSFLTGAAIFLVLLLLQLMIALFNKAYKRGGFVKTLNWLLLVILCFLSLKGFNDFYNNLPGVQSLFKNIYSNTGLEEIVITYKIETYTFLILSILAFVLYFVIALVVAKKNDKEEKELEKRETERIKPLAPYSSPFENHERIDDPLYDLPRQEEVLETQIEEKAVIKQILFEQSNLNEIYDTDFGFKNCSMVKGDAYVDYYVNKVKFLTLSNHNRTMSFRLELDKAIRLIIQYPLIGKDKYEDHKIWFKIEDASVLSKEVLVGIIRDAYTTVLNNV